MAATHTTKTPRTRHQAAREPDLLGLDSITAVLSAEFGFLIDRTTTARWLARGINGARLRGRRIGKRWACDRGAIKAFLIASGAAPEAGG